MDDKPKTWNAILKDLERIEMAGTTYRWQYIPEFGNSLVPVDYVSVRREDIVKGRKFTARSGKRYMICSNNSGGGMLMVTEDGTLGENWQTRSTLVKWLGGDHNGPYRIKHWGWDDDAS